MALQKLNNNYLDFNTLQTKNPIVVVQIPGVDLLASATTYTKIKFGDPDLVYGEPGVVWGGQRPVAGQRSLLSLEGSSLTISQRLEPEQGRSAVSQLSLAFVDVGGYMSQVVSPGIILDDILGKDVKVWFGYEQISFPEDYFTIFRGIVTGVTNEPGRVILQFSDPNAKRRQQIFFTGKTKLNGSITDSATTVPVVSNTDFHRKILGPTGVYDQFIKTYIVVEDEVIEYQRTGFEGTSFGVNTFTNCLRGQRGTTAVAHASGVDCQASLEISGLGIEIALKLMLSGWNGPWTTGVVISAFAVTGDPDLGVVENCIVLPDKVDAVINYGLTVGDQITITGATNPANNLVCIVTGFQDILGSTNRGILVDQIFTSESPSPAVLALRSQWDVWPLTCGSKLTTNDVDVDAHIFYRDTYFGSAEDAYRFYIKEPTSGKTFIESEIMLPFAAYTLTRQGKLSMGFTKPPLADQRTVRLNVDNVKEPQNIKPMRATNNRKFFNELNWEFDTTDDGRFTSQVRALDTESLSIIGLSSVLPIKSKGARTDLGFESIVNRRNTFLLQRYKRGAVIFTMKTNWGTGCQIEAGDIVLVDDQGELKIANYDTGEANIGQKLMEVIDRSLDIKSGDVSLQLLSGVQANANDRYATIAPSSLVTTGSTTTKVRIKDSFGAIFPGRESDKWVDYVGMTIIVHSTDFTTRYGDTVFVGVDPADNYALMVSPALGFTPQVDDIVDLGNYSTSADPMFEQVVKVMHVFQSPTVTVVSGSSNTTFDVAPGDIAKFQEGAILLIHDTTYSILSPEVEVLTILGNTITVDSSLGFTPAAGQFVELIGFADGGQAYRHI